MASLSHLVPFHCPSSSSSSSSHKLGFSFCCPVPPPHRHRNSNHSRFCASATKKPSGRRAKSNADLFNDIKEFLSTVGLPHDHVPSTKELSSHGRQDLANIVRRRGYKFMRELLANSTEAETNGCSSKENLIGERQSLDDCQGQNEEVNGSSSNMSLSMEAAKLKHPEIDLFEDDSMSTEASRVEVNETPYVEDASVSPGAAEANILESSITSSKTNTKPHPDNHIRRAQESSVYPFLQEKVAKFIQDGELDSIEENDLCGVEVINGSIASFSHQVEDQVLEIYPARIESASTEEARIINCAENLGNEAQKVENQKEINRLKLLLHQKELELTQLKEHIENEKLALSMFQKKAEREISEAQKLISEKDAEQHATEESLSGLEEVEIQLWSDGEVVEVAGSFNGWQQRIKMESQPPSSISTTNRSQKSRLWKTLLWLYPGVYEIKFIVDGHWTVDSHRESVTRGSIHNNVVRVGRG